MKITIVNIDSIIDGKNESFKLLFQYNEIVKEDANDYVLIKSVIKNYNNQTFYLVSWIDGDFFDTFQVQAISKLYANIEIKLNKVHPFLKNTILFIYFIFYVSILSLIGFSAKILPIIFFFVCSLYPIFIYTIRNNFHFKSINFYLANQLKYGAYVLLFINFLYSIDENSVVIRKFLMINTFSSFYNLFFCFLNFIILILNYYLIKKTFFKLKTFNQP